MPGIRIGDICHSPRTFVVDGDSPYIDAHHSRTSGLAHLFDERVKLRSTGLATRRRKLLWDERNGDTLSDAAELVRKFGIDQLSVEQRVAVIEEIWRSIDARAVHVVLPSPVEIAMFQQRMFEDDLFDEEEEDLFVFPPGTH